LFAISEAGLTLEASRTDDTLKIYPPERLAPEFAAAIKEHKTEIIRIMREDEEMRRTGTGRCEGKTFDSALDHRDLTDDGDAK
jgi:hypothetical protein